MADPLPKAPGRELPRRCYLDLASPAEKAIRDAMAAVEDSGASVALTDAVVLLGAAHERVADHVDGVEGQRKLPADFAPDGRYIIPPDARARVQLQAVCPDCGRNGWVQCELHEGTHRKTAKCVGAVTAPPPAAEARPERLPDHPGEQSIPADAELEFPEWMKAQPLPDLFNRFNNATRDAAFYPDDPVKARVLVREWGRLMGALAADPGALRDRLERLEKRLDELANPVFKVPAAPGHAKGSLHVGIQPPAGFEVERISPDEIRVIVREEAKKALADAKPPVLEIRADEKPDEALGVKGAFMTPSDMRRR